MWSPEDVANKADHEGGMEELFRWGFNPDMISDEYPELKHNMGVLEILFWAYENLRREINLPEPSDPY